MFQETSPPDASQSNKTSVRVVLENIQDNAKIDNPNARHPFNGAQIPYFGRVSIARRVDAVRTLTRRKHLFFSPE